MPLPQNYYELISRENNQKKKQEQVARNQSIYPDFGPKAPDREPGGAIDFLGATLWGAASGLSWGASEYFVPYGETWEEMSDAERAGWILGEGGSMFMPYVGPFAFLGKGGRAVTKAFGNKYVQEAIEKTASEGVELLSKGTAKAMIESGLPSKHSRKVLIED